MKYYLLTSFFLNSRTNKQYGWSFACFKSLFWEMPNQFSSSFMVGLSQREYYPVFGVYGTFWCIFVFFKYLSKSITYYEIVKKCKSQLIICWDDASIHNSKIVKIFWRKKQSSLDNPIIVLAKISGRPHWVNQVKISFILETWEARISVIVTLLI